MLASTAKVKLDFLCVGFPKCGTTALDYVLKKNPNIFLPETKETHFFSKLGKNSLDAHNYLKDVYSKSKGYKLVGGVEPSYNGYAEAVHRYFGSELKIIICLRNTIDMLYSFAKMQAGRYPLEWWGMLDYLKKYGEFSPVVFDEWVRKYAGYFHFSGDIKSYYNLYPREQVKFLLIEDLISRPGDTFDDLQRFLGLESSEIINVESFPQKNKGDVVACSYNSAKVNQIVHEKIYFGDGQGNNHNKELFYSSLLSEILKYTTKKYDKPMLEETRKWLRDFFVDEWKEIEALTQIPVTQIWK